MFHFKIRLLFSSLLNRTIDLDIKVLNQVLLTLASDHGFPPLEPETSSLFGLIVDTSVDIALTGQLYHKLIQQVYF
jgi:hypothetical protein